MPAALTAVDLFRTELMSPPTLAPAMPIAGRTYAWEEEREMDLAAANLAAWRERMAFRFANLRSLASEVTPEAAKDGLQEAIEAITPHIRTVAGDLEKYERKFRRASKYAATQAMRAEVERIGSKAIAEMRNHHDFLVGLYYDLKALQAELDPYSRGGPSFEHAGPLLEQLKKPRSAA